MWPSKPIILMDGATGTELGRRGVDISLPLWSARALIDGQTILAEIHRDYLEAGADAITTATFRTHRRSLEKAGMGGRAEELTKRAVAIAVEMRDRYNRKALVLGSVAPLEDCYKPELAPAADVCDDEHGEMIGRLLAAGVDGVAIETQNNRRESLAAAKQAQDQAPGRWMISFCTKSDGPPGTLLSGEPLTDLLPMLASATAVGVNCVAAPATEAQVKLLRLLLEPSVLVSAYANVSKAGPSGEWVNTDAVDPEIYAQYAARWVNAGATIIGGCCGTRPDMIRAIAKRLGQQAAAAR
ncbi:MAG: homocysteine S-methyltransferase family protein [Phycisphaerales bacterium]|nr:homocysteine S-methyltransferase family protein [Phycisphaerales bacterium]MCI0629877.1 homocysteine S-methyltransferase family protein [Phycisphaerales bacterium]MCI0675044.1 homocysteine S-methyltransferase family protein [Phycisphaerales bacterium]